MPCNFLWNVRHCSCDLCKFFVIHLRSEKVSPVSSICRQMRPKATLATRKHGLTCALCSHNKPGCLKHKHERTHTAAMFTCKQLRHLGTGRDVCVSPHRALFQQTDRFSVADVFLTLQSFTPSLSSKLNQSQCFSLSGRG